MENTFSLLRGFSEVSHVKMDKLRKTLFRGIHDNIEYPRNTNDYSICKSPGI